MTLDSRSRWLRIWSRPFERYAAAIVLALIAFGMRVALDPLLGPRAPFTLFYPAILAAAWFGGLAAGVVTLLASLILSAILINPAGVAVHLPEDRWSMAVFLAVAALMLVGTEIVRKARAATEAEADRTRRILEEVGGGFVLVDTNWRCLFANREIERIAGMSRHELTGLDVRAPLRLDAATVAQLERALRGRESVEYELFHAPTGRWYLHRAFPLAEGAGLFLLDVTARKRDEQAVRENREVLLHALKASRMGYWSWDIASNDVTWSQNLEDVHGMPPGSFDGKLETFLSMIHPDDRPAVEAALQRSLADGSDYDVEFRVVAPDGRIEWIAGRGIVETRDGKAVRMTGLGMNVSARRAADADRLLLASIVSSSDDAIVSKDLDGRILSWNRAAEEMFGYRAEEVLGKPVAILLPPGRADEFSANMDRVRGGVKVRHHETLRRRKNGEVFEAALTISPIKDERGRIVGASKIARDISAAKAAERDRERTREMFLAILGHDLRNPLNTIAASLYTLEKETLPDSARRVLPRMSRSMERMARMIEQLLDFTRARLGSGIPVQPAPCDLRALCSSVIEDLETQYPGRIRFESDAQVDGQWDADRLAQVFSNLIVNGLQHGTPEEPVDVRLHGCGSEARVEIRNSGNPIREEDRRAIFEPFRQGDSGGRDSSSLGLGLYIASQIVRSHGGSIDASSADGYTTFVVKLPISVPATTPG